MSEISNIKNFEEKLVYDLISGRNKDEIAKELVEKGLISQDHVWEFIHNFEQYLLGGSRFIGKEGNFFQEILHKYRNSPQGRQWLRKIYKSKINSGIKWSLIFFVILIVALLLSRSNRYVWIDITVAISFFGLVVSIFWIMTCFTRWYKVR